MSGSAIYDEVHSAISTEDQRIAGQLMEIQEMMELLKTARRPLMIGDLWETFRNICGRFDEKRLVIVVSGLTSSGKSSLLNALLGFNLLFTAPDHCTPCSVSMERSQNDTETFFQDSRDLGSKKRRSAKELAAATDFKSEAPSHQPLFVFLSAQESDRGIMRVGKQLRLVDTPGIHENSFRENSDLNADAFVFVIDLCSGTNWEDLGNVMKMAGLRTKPVLIVFSKIDQVQRNSQRRFEIERAKWLQEAKRFLAANRKAAEEAIFFLAPKAAVTKRRHDAEVQALREAILKTKQDRRGKPVALLIGSEGSGKTTLCADLIADQLPNIGGPSTPCFVVYTAAEQATSQVRYEQLSQQESFANAPIPGHRGRENLHPEKCLAVREEMGTSTKENFEIALKAATRGNPSSKIHVTLSKRTLPSNSLLQKDFSVIDTPPFEDIEDPPACPKPSVLVVVVSSDKRPKEMRNHVKACLRTAEATSDTHVYLAVTKWKAFREQCADMQVVEERKRTIKETFRSCLQDFQQSSSGARKVFFIESEALMEEYEACFAEFETRLMKAAHDEFTAFKLGAINRSVTELLEEIGKQINEKIYILKETEESFDIFADSISEKALTDNKDTDESADEDTSGTVHLLRATRASRFLSPTRQLPDNESEMRELFYEFLKFYQKDVTKEIRRMSQEAVKQFYKVDVEAVENAKKFYDDQIKAIAKQLELKGGKPSDIYGLKSMLDDFMNLIPTPVEEEFLMRVENLKTLSNEILNRLNTLHSKQNVTVIEMERLQKKLERLMSVDTSSDEASLVRGLEEDFENLKKKLEDTTSEIEERKTIAAKTREKAEEKRFTSAKEIGVIESTIRQMQSHLQERLDRWEKKRRSLTTRFSNYLFSDYFTKKEEQAQREEKEEIQNQKTMIRNIKEDIQGSMTEAEKKENEVKQSQDELQKLSEKQRKMEEDLITIFRQVAEAKKKMEKDRRKIAEKQEYIDKDYTERQKRIQETQETFSNTQESVRLAEDEFLRKKTRWDTMKREYYQKLLTQLENMSNMLLLKILQDLHRRTRQFSDEEKKKLNVEQCFFLAVRAKLTALLSA